MIIKSGDLCKFILMESGSTFFGVILYRITHTENKQYLPHIPSKREKIWCVYDYEICDIINVWNSEISEIVQSL